jgi:hypothetical protein
MQNNNILEINEMHAVDVTMFVENSLENHTNEF